MKHTLTPLLWLAGGLAAGAALAAAGGALFFTLGQRPPDVFSQAAGAALLLAAPLGLIGCGRAVYKRQMGRFLRTVSAGVLAVGGISSVAVAGGLGYFVWDGVQRGAALAVRADAQRVFDGHFDAVLRDAAQNAEPRLLVEGAYRAPSGVLVSGFVVHPPAAFRIEDLRVSTGAVREAVWLDARTFVEGTVQLDDYPVRRFAALIADAAATQTESLFVETGFGRAEVPDAVQAPPQVQSLRMYHR